VSDDDFSAVLIASVLVLAAVVRFMVFLWARRRWRATLTEIGPPLSSGTGTLLDGSWATYPVRGREVTLMMEVQMGGAWPKFGQHKHYHLLQVPCRMVDFRLQARFPRGRRSFHAKIQTRYGVKWKPVALPPGVDAAVCVDRPDLLDEAALQAIADLARIGCRADLGSISKESLQFEAYRVLSAGEASAAMDALAALAIAIEGRAGPKTYRPGR
jgi:hypothetical protein